jgi:hypothetical protein
MISSELSRALENESAFRRGNHLVMSMGGSVVGFFDSSVRNMGTGVWTRKSNIGPYPAFNVKMRDGHVKFRTILGIKVIIAENIGIRCETADGKKFTDFSEAKKHAEEKLNCIGT